MTAPTPPTKRPANAEPLIHSTKVKAAALCHYPWKAHVHDPDSYRVTTTQAAQIFAVDHARVKQLITAGRIPYETHRGGTYLMRRHNSRSSRTRGFADRVLLTGGQPRNC